jgi:hypothetical protein
VFFKLGFELGLESNDVFCNVILQRLLESEILLNYQRIFVSILLTWKDICI